MSEKWEVLTSEAILEHPLLTVSIEQVRLPNGEVIADWPKVQGRDLVSAAVFNAAGEVLVWEAYQHGTGWIVWQVVNGYVAEGDDPVTAVKQALEQTGYTSDDWVYMGSYVADAHQHVGVGHFFSTRRVIPIPDFIPAKPGQTVRWVSLSELRHAIVDGRLATINSAMCIALTLLTL